MRIEVGAVRVRGGANQQWDLSHRNQGVEMSYIDGFLLAVPTNKREAYLALAKKSWPLFKEWGAVRHVECWSDDVPHGKTTDFFRAVKAKDGESVVFSWVEYPSKKVRDAANKKMREDPRMKEWGEAMKFVDGKRMVFGGFVPMMDRQA
jgi:uncharacterized protein YbaA (DUF1428 family)